jgi:hypothetical protein
MPPMQIRELTLQYLASPEIKNSVVHRLSQSPYDAFDAILGFQGPYPETIHPIDVHEDYLTPLLAELLRACPQLLIGPDPARIPRRPFILLGAAIAANDPRFADTILSGLKDRSIYVKLAAVDGILRCSFLRTPEVKQQLQRLLAMKSIAKDEYAVKPVPRRLGHVHTGHKMSSARIRSHINAARAAVYRPGVSPADNEAGGSVGTNR